MAKEGITGDSNLIGSHYQKICEIVDRATYPLIVSTEFGGMVDEGNRLSKISDQIVVKIPMTKNGVMRHRNTFPTIISKQIVLIIFSPGQALLAAKAGANYVSPFIGRLDDISSDGLSLISEIRQNF